MPVSQYPHLSRPRAPHRVVGLWLLGCCAMVFVMVVIGALTRLTHSGLSIVEWRPVTGIVPPLSMADWQKAFALYKTFPEYQAVNVDMTL